ncbi:hypothetical protein [Streptomyces sp. NPDC004266]|uniref:hypothetical protein n=1 Tax=Streptomyces sp. NPDC004266 TaxID=3364693 RepID=UPI003682B18C
MVTLADVTRHAGVSAGTVGYVLSGRRSGSAPTRHGIDALGHRPHAGARTPTGLRGAATPLVVRNEAAVEPLLTPLLTPRASTGPATASVS